MKQRCVRQYSNLLWKLSSAVLVMLCISCGGGSPSSHIPEVSLYSADSLASITLSVTGGPLEIGDTVHFTAMGAYSDGTTKNITADVTWSSSNPAVAQVTTAGLVTALSAGSTSISADLDGQSASSTVSVTPALNYLSVSPAGSSMQLGETLQLTATGTYADASSRNLTGLTSWTTSNSSVATVDHAGVVTATGAGLCSITATISGVSNSASLRVWPSLSSIEVMPADPQMELQTTQHFTALGIYSDGSERDLTGIAEWSSGNASVAGVSEPGVVYATASGSSVVSATWKGIQGSSMLTVHPQHLASLVIDQDGVTLPIGIPQQLTATGVFSDAVTQTLRNVSWSSSDPKILSIEENGVAWTHSPGSITVTASAGSIVGTGTVTVSDVALTEISLAPEGLSMPAGVQKQLALVALFDDDTTRNLSTGVTWESSNPSVASVSQDGRVTPFTLGSTTIKATLRGQSRSASVMVTEATLVSITVDASSATSPAGIEQQFTARGTYSDGTTEDVSGIAAWISSDGSTATISDTGVLKGMHAGTVSVIADIAGNEGTAPFEVNPAVLTGLTIAPSDILVPQGNYIQYKATATYSDGSTQDVTSNANWSSTVADLVGIDNHGLAIAHRLGTATVKAAIEEQSVLSNITVAGAGSVTSEASAPTVSASGYFLMPTITMNSSTPGVWIYYTTDGTIPTTASTLYDGPMTISNPTTIRAIAAGGTYTPSAITRAWFTVGAATPTISPVGYFAIPPTVTITSSPGVSIYYTLDGSTPTIQSTPYTGPFTVSSTTTIKAIAVGGGYSQSLVGSGSISISNTAPE